MTNKPVLVVMGILGRSPFAGVAWQALHYLEGFRRLGFDVYYAEDTGDWPFDADQNTVTCDPTYTLQYIAHQMGWWGEPDHWAYRCAANGQIYGMSGAAFSSILERAEVLVNVTGATMMKDEYLRVPVRIYVESDPFEPQVQVAMGNSHAIQVIEGHTHFCTFAENFGKPGCQIPEVSFEYCPTRQPVVLDWWNESEDVLVPRKGNISDFPFTTISSWEQKDKDVEWNGEIYLWSKHQEFLKFIDLPKRTKQPLEIALSTPDPDVLSMLRSYGWRVSDAVALSKEILPYRDYIQASRGEFTVAKDQYVRPWTGWFSDRSATFLAAGRPVITQDTGFGDVIPTGRGLFAYRTIDEILDAIDRINSDYIAHQKAAIEIASEYFSAERVLESMLDRIGV